MGNGAAVSKVNSGGAGDTEAQPSASKTSKVDDGPTSTPVVRIEGSGEAEPTASVSDKPPQASTSGASEGKTKLPQSNSNSPASAHGGSPGGGGSSLAQRRAAQGRLAGGLSVNVEKLNPRRMVLGQLQSASDNSNATVRKIEKVDSFDTLFVLGGEVMPSVHPGMDIRYAKRVADNHRVVIKVRKKSNSFASGQEEREWRQSAEFMLNLPKSQSIAEIHGVWEDKEAYYVVMERVGGSDLFELLDAEGMLPLAETKAILRQLVKGVAALHAKGCIHKDLKLENVMVDRTTLKRAPTRGEGEEPIVKLIDFDTAVTWEPSSPKAKTVLGTDQYISAEAYAGNYSPASDMFAVGVIAYKLVTGHFPFNSKMFDDEAGENWVGSPKMKQIQQRVVRAKINYAVKPFPDNPAAAEFIKQLLCPTDMDRMTAVQALEHEFLADVMSPQRTSKVESFSD
mmetsp:Transcript_1181/g.2562  ORF Transcript_1181/g.2562 Transcript_1181/m.2562 type:complete len:454 (-) Transcript_1181:73-1434(-)